MYGMLERHHVEGTGAARQIMRFLRVGFQRAAHHDMQLEIGAEHGTRLAYRCHGLHAEPGVLYRPPGRPGADAPRQPDALPRRQVYELARRTIGCVNK